MDAEFSTVLAAWNLDDASPAPLGKGLINHTWLVRHDSGQYVLQRVNPMFGQDIHRDIAAITTWLVNHGQVSPELVPTVSQDLYLELRGATWRLYTWIDGISHDTIVHPGMALEAGLLLARFHQALTWMPHELGSQRTGVHDTVAHLAWLRETVARRTDHARYAVIAPLASAILETARTLPALPPTPPCRVHGDPKINNFLFDKVTGKGLCMVDFDTLANMALPLELGDAMRSWCNPAGENTPETGFSLEYFAAALEGYASVNRTALSSTEWLAILPATQTICLELAARFCADALNEDYFSWDPEHYPSHSHHSETRARGQFNVLQALIRQEAEAGRILIRAGG